EQSIEQSLSTFSSHMVNIVDILKRAEYNSLTLFDELGAGTDPTEGAVLAISILDKLRNSGIRTVATTHYNQLKTYALTTENVANAAMEFDIETLSPTYRLLIGVPGKSNAFEISKRLGLPDEIIDNARALVDSESVEFEDVLSAIESDRQKSEADREETDRLRREVESIKSKLEAEKQKTADMRENILDKARKEAAKILKDTKEEAELIVDELKELSSSMEKDKARRLQQAQDMLRESSKKIDSSLQEDILRVKNTKPPKDLKKGDTVEVLSLNQIGTVLDKPDSSKNVMVQIGLMKVSLPINNLRLSNVNIEAEDRKVKNIVQTKSKYIKKSIDLRGKNIEEAIVELDKYLDDAYLSGLKQVEIIHGKGTGALREGLKPYFKRNRHVKSTRMGEFNEGGTGVTVVELK
ncbi:MAG: endonuclease MutS2, partial [Tissierellia bacterium]|nr:endonuclease MutS2 [Tissierellia bacterium]